MKIQIDKQEEKDNVTRFKITSGKGVEYRVIECKFTGGLIINKYEEDNRSLNITPRVSNEILIE